MNFPGILRAPLDRTLSSLPMLIFAVNVINNVSSDNWQHGNSQANEHENQTKITRRLVNLVKYARTRVREREIVGYLFDTTKNQIPPLPPPKDCICF